MERLCQVVSIESSPRSFLIVKWNQGAAYPVVQSVARKFSDKFRSEDQIEKGSPAIFVVNRQDKYIEIINDRYGSVPIFVYSSGDTTMVFTHFTDLFEQLEPQLTIDNIGFWESVVFDMTIGVRTLFSEIQQIPPGTKLRIGASGSKVTYDRWYNWQFEPVLLDDPVEIGDFVVNALHSALTELPKSERYILPISGGVDSRLLAACIVAHVPSDKIDAVTFAYSKKSYEYKYAKRICEYLGINSHLFHQLTPQLYTGAIPIFCHKRAGALSIAHCHITSLLTAKNVGYSQADRLVTGIFADAAAGFAALPPELKEDNIQVTRPYSQMMRWRNHLTGHILDGMKTDLSVIFEEWGAGKSKSSIDTFNEYFYISQRQHKLLFMLGHVYSDYVQVSHPYTGPGISGALFGLSYNHRRWKGGIRAALSIENPALGRMPDISSRRRIETWSDRIRQAYSENYRRLGKLLSLVSGDKMLLKNPFRTEMQDYYLRTAHRDLFIQSMNDLSKWGLIRSQDERAFAGKNYRYINDTYVQYRFISITETIRWLKRNGAIN